MRKMAMLVVVLGLVVVWTASAYGAEALYTCKVINAGPVTKESNGATVSPAQVRFKLTRVSGPTSFTNLVTRAVTGQEKQMLATALTALVNGHNVEVWLDPAVGTAFNMQLK